MGEIVDPKLEADVQMFISQESEHGREHARYNRMVSAQGYDLTRIGKTFSTIRLRNDRFSELRDWHPAAVQIKWLGKDLGFDAV